MAERIAFAGIFRSSACFSKWEETLFSAKHAAEGNRRGTTIF
jgi:hypothetical protein